MSVKKISYCPVCRGSLVEVPTKDLAMKKSGVETVNEVGYSCATCEGLFVIGQVPKKHVSSGQSASIAKPA